MTRQRADTSPKVPGIKQKDAKVALCVAVVLSAQTTDVSVNKVTPALFQRYPTIKDLANAEQSEVEAYIKTIGLYRSKAKNIIGLAQFAHEHYNDSIPNTMDELV